MNVSEFVRNEDAQQQADTQAQLAAAQIGSTQNLQAEVVLTPVQVELLKAQVGGHKGF